ncbi:MAG: hypothetical protein ABSD47_01205 [Candidatus Methylomirabilota bacterium]|jgi:hypothetical protein
MPHYKDGTLAQVGDIVKGKGYNVKGPDGELKEIVGQVLEITPMATRCNVVLAYFKQKDLGTIDTFKYPDGDFFPKGPGVLVTYNDKSYKAIVAAVELGQADQFEKIA